MLYKWNKTGLRQKISSWETFEWGEGEILDVNRRRRSAHSSVSLVKTRRRPPDDDSVCHTRRFFGDSQNILQPVWLRDDCFYRDAATRYRV